jgi:hypothetical protein
MAAFESGSAWGVAAITKFGWIKLFSLGSALLGAGMMALFRPPKTKRELFIQGAVALTASLLFGNVATDLADYWLDFIDLNEAPMQKIIEFTVVVHSLVGALSWGVFGGIAQFRDKLADKPLEAIKDAKSTFTKI